MATEVLLLVVVVVLVRPEWRWREGRMQGRGSIRVVQLRCRCARP